MVAWGRRVSKPTRLEVVADPTSAIPAKRGADPAAVEPAEPAHSPEILDNPGKPEAVIFV